MDQSVAAAWKSAPSVEGVINYVGAMDIRPEFFARDYSRDNLVIDAEPMPVRDMRAWRDAVSIENEGFMLADHKSAVADFRDDAEVRATYLEEARALIRDLSGADKVIMSPGAILRFGERSPAYRQSFNSRPARFVHVDLTPVSAPGLIKPHVPEGAPWPPARRVIGFNVWRVISAPPQDVPLALCDVRSIAERDRVPADAVLGVEHGVGFSFEAFLLRHNPAHRWAYFSGMTRDEALVFKNFDTQAPQGGGVPHVAFDDPTCPADAGPRGSLEVRGFAFFE